MIFGRRDERENQEGKRAHHLVETRAEQKIDLAHIIGGARHGISHWLQIVEGHAFAEQAGIQFTAHIAFNALGAELKAKVARKLQQPPPHPTADDGQKDPQQRLIIKRLSGNDGKRRANLHAGNRHQTGVAQGAYQRNEQNPPFVQRVRNHPARG